jgi:glycine/D-amino acid oxidase-like deaminating enzyme
MRVSVIGAGYAGLATCWYLLQNPNIEVTLYDGGAGASWASTGLMYPFPGRKASRSWLAIEGMEATNELISVVEQTLGKPVAHRGGVLRKPWVEWQKSVFTKIVKKDPTVSLQDGNLWVPHGVAVYSKPYLEGLLKACQSIGLIYKQERISSLSDLIADQIVLATGSETLQFVDLPLKKIKGQALLCRWGKDALPYSLISNGHITPTEDPELCMLGSSYETEFTSSDPDPAVIPILLEKIGAFYPPARDFEVLDIVSGIRMTPIEGYRPIVQKMDDKTHVFTGLGSRGLLYHALLGKKLAADITSL